MPKKNKTEETEENVWTSSISTKSHMSYEKYLKIGLEIISPRLSIRCYKLAPKDEYPFFERGKDLRITIFIDDKPATDTRGWKYEFVIEVPFWMQSCTNKEDRTWMRHHADTHLQAFDAASKRGKEAAQKEKKKKSKTKITKKSTRKTKTKVGSTQDVFEKMKSK